MPVNLGVSILIGCGFIIFASIVGLMLAGELYDRAKSFESKKNIVIRTAMIGQIYFLALSIFLVSVLSLLYSWTHPDIFNYYTILALYIVILLYNFRAGYHDLRLFEKSIRIDKGSTETTILLPSLAEKGSSLRWSLSNVKVIDKNILEKQLKSASIFSIIVTLTFLILITYWLIQYKSFQLLGIVTAIVSGAYFLLFLFRYKYNKSKSMKIKSICKLEVSKDLLISGQPFTVRFSDKSHREYDTIIIYLDEINYLSKHLSQNDHLEVNSKHKLGRFDYPKNRILTAHLRTPNNLKPTVEFGPVRRKYQLRVVLKKENIQKHHAFRLNLISSNHPEP